MARNLAGVVHEQPDPVLAEGPSLLQSIWLRRYLVAVVTVVAFAVGLGLSSLQPPVYSATATVLLTDPAEAELFGRGSQDPERHVQQQASRMQSRSVFAGAASALGDSVSARDLSRRVSITADPAVGVIDVTASASDPQAAARAANAVARTFESVSKRAGSSLLETAAQVFDEEMAALRTEATRLRRRVNTNPNSLAAQSSLEAVEAQLAALQTRLSELTTEIAFYGSGIDSIEVARAPAQPSSPQPLRDGALAAGLGLALASAIVYWRAGTATGQRGYVGALLDAPLLAQIPDFASLGEDTTEMLVNPRVVEAYQFLVSSVEYALGQTDGSSVLVTSAVPGEGKSLTALHLARALALQGRDVALVDSDIRSRGLTHMLEAEDRLGLVDLAQGHTLEVAEHTYRLSERDVLTLVPAGTPQQSATGLLSTAAYREAIAYAIASHEVTVIDAEPLLTYADASAVAHQVAGILLVVDAETSEARMMQVEERLQFVPAPLLGYVVNRSTAGRKARGGGVSHRVSDDAAPDSVSSPQATNRMTRTRGNGHRSSHRVSGRGAPSGGDR